MNQLLGLINGAVFGWFLTFEIIPTIIGALIGLGIAFFIDPPNKKESELRIEKSYDEFGYVEGFKYYKGEKEVDAKPIEPDNGPPKITKRDADEAYEIFKKYQKTKVEKGLTLIEQKELERKRALDI